MLAAHKTMPSPVKNIANGLLGKVHKEREKGGRPEKMPGHGDSPESQPTSVALPGRRNLPLTFGSFR